MKQYIITIADDGTPSIREFRDVPGPGPVPTQPPGGRVPTPTNPDNNGGLYRVNPDGTVTTTRTGHAFFAAQPGEGIWSYYRRQADAFGLNKEAAAGLTAYLTGEDVVKIVPAHLHGDQKWWPVLIDIFAFPGSYGIGTAISNSGGGDAPGTPNHDELLPGAIDVRTLSVGELTNVMLNLRSYLNGSDNTYGPIRALQRLSAFLDYGIKDAGYHAGGENTGFVVPPDGFPQLASMTIEEARRIAGISRAR